MRFGVSLLTPLEPTWGNEFIRGFVFSISVPPVLLLEQENNVFIIHFVVLNSKSELFTFQGSILSLFDCSKWVSFHSFAQIQRRAHNINFSHSHCAAFQCSTAVSVISMMHSNRWEKGWFSNPDWLLEGSATMLRQLGPVLDLREPELSQVPARS